MKLITRVQNPIHSKIFIAWGLGKENSDLQKAINLIWTYLRANMSRIIAVQQLDRIRIGSVLGQVFEL